MNVYEKAGEKMLKGLAAGAVIVLGCAPGLAQPSDSQPAKFCKSVASARELKPTTELARAAAAAFGAPGFDAEDTDCIYPFALLRYGDVDVLLSQDIAPESGRIADAPDLSATVLRRVPNGWRRVKIFNSFGKGASGVSTPSATAITIGGDDAIAMEGGSVDQGYAFLTLELYAFRRQGLIRLDAGGTLYLAASDNGAVGDSQATDVTAAWSIDAPNELAIDYVIGDAKGKRQARAVWQIGDTGLTLKSGAPPKELKHMMGGG
jgi:hypothetical protein